MIELINGPQNKGLVAMVRFDPASKGLAVVRGEGQCIQR